MTDIAITYEDGLRLSELQGQLAQLQFDLDHVATTTLEDKLLACFAVMFLICVLMYVVNIVVQNRLYDKKASDDEKFRAWLVLVLVAIILSAVLSYLAMELVQNLAVLGIESQMTNVQGQMDAIYAKYGGA